MAKREQRKLFFSGKKGNAKSTGKIFYRFLLLQHATSTSPRNDQQAALSFRALLIAATSLPKCCIQS
jgi:hypothetical protein